MRPNPTSIIIVLLIVLASLPQVIAEEDPCKVLDCSVVINANKFVVGDDEIVSAYLDGTLVGYVFLTSDIVDLVGYSGKPIKMLVGMDLNATITGVKIISHSEPIMLVGIPEKALVDFVAQYVGKNVGDRIIIGGKQEEGYERIDSITGATLTAVQAGATIMESARIVAIKKGILVAGEEAAVKVSSKYEKKTWDELLREGSIANLYVSKKDVGKGESDEAWMDLYFAYINQPTIGRNILGEKTYNLVRSIFNESHLIFVGGRGEGSFKGKAYVRGGIFDRIKIEQGFDIFIFTDRDFINLYTPPPGIPYFKERVVFAIRSKKFDPTKPFTLTYLTEGRTFSKKYRLPDKYIIKQEPENFLIVIWRQNLIPFLVGMLVLSFVIYSYARREYFVRNRRLARGGRYFVMGVSLLYLGFLNPNLPSITHVLNPIIQRNLSWDLYLSDPIIFGLFIFLLFAAMASGRVFCGEVCPYGSLIEFLYRIVPYRKELPRRVHEKLLLFKYVILGVLIFAAMVAGSAALELAEIEPFKTTFYIRNRPALFVSYALALLMISAVNNRFFCKYLCPLGALMGIMSHFQVFKIKRHRLCGKCRICEKECPWQVIERDGRGRVNQRECFRCGECEMNYYDENKCPALIRRKRRGRAV